MMKKRDDSKFPDTYVYITHYTKFTAILVGGPKRLILG